MSPDPRQFTAQLRLSIAREQLAEAIYVNRALALQLPDVEFKSLPFEVRELYRETALATLDALTPQLRGSSPYFAIAVSLMRNEAAKVIGTIAPKVAP